ADVPPGQHFGSRLSGLHSQSLTMHTKQPVFWRLIGQIHTVRGRAVIAPICNRIVGSLSVTEIGHSDPNSMHQNASRVHIERERLFPETARKVRVPLFPFIAPPNLAVDLHFRPASSISNVSGSTR